VILYITNIYLYCHAKDVTVVSTCYLDKLSGDRKVTACRWRSRVISKNHMLYSREASRHNFWQVSPIITYVFVDVRRFKPYCELVNGELPIKKKKLISHLRPVSFEARSCEAFERRFSLSGVVFDEWHVKDVAKSFVALN